MQFGCFRNLTLDGKLCLRDDKNAALDKDKDKDGLLHRSEYMEFGCRGVHHTYIHTYIHTYT